MAMGGSSIEQDGAGALDPPHRIGRSPATPVRHTCTLLRMGLARGLERRLERLVDGLAARLFRGRIHPVELGSRLVREADLALFETPAGPGVPNVFRVVLGGDPVGSDVLVVVRHELEEFVEAAAAERGWRLEGPARVIVQISPERRPSSAEIEAWVEPGARPPWMVLVPAGGREPGPAVTTNRAVVGRSGECDVRVPGDDVSRKHALVWRESGTAWMVDLGSSNGTFLNGARLSGPAPLGEGDRVTFGASEFVVGWPV